MKKEKTELWDCCIWIIFVTTRRLTDLYNVMQGRMTGWQLSIGWVKQPIIVTWLQRI